VTIHHAEEVHITELSLHEEILFASVLNRNHFVASTLRVESES
jgi:hypothetical protein